MDKPRRRRHDHSTLLALLLTMTLPSCMTIGLWELGDGPSVYVSDSIDAPRARLLVDAFRHNIRVHPKDTPEALTARGLTSITLISNSSDQNVLAHALLQTPGLLRNPQIKLHGTWPLHSPTSGVAHLNIQGTLDPEPLAQVHPDARRVVPAIWTDEQPISQHSVWRIGLTDTPQATPDTPFEQHTVDFQFDVVQQRSGGSSWPLRTMQVVLTPAAVALDFVVTPSLFIYYCFINPPRYMF